MSDGKLFRSQIGGFNKDDVNNYIKETDEKHLAELEKYRAEITVLTQKTDEVSSLAADLQEKLVQAESALAELQSKSVSDEAALLSVKNTLADKEKELAEVQKAMAFYKSESEAQIRVMASQKEEIKVLTEKLHVSSAEAEKKLGEASEHADMLEKEKNALTAKISEMDALLSEKNALLAEKDSSIETLTENLACFEKENNVLEDKYTVLAEEIRTMREEAQKAAQFDENTEDKNSPAYKIGMYDKISSQLGDILITANRDADDLIVSAKEEAEHLRREVDLECENKRAECDATVARIKSETEEEAAYIRERLSQAANELLTTVSGDLHGSIENCVREINTSFTDIQYEFKTLLSKIANRSSEMNERVNYYQSCVSDGIEEKLAAMDEKYGIVHTDKTALTDQNHA